MLDFLKTVFGDRIGVSEYSFPDKTPVYIRDGYKLQQLTWNNNPCVLLSPRTASWRLPTLKKQLKNFQEICEFPCALYLEGMTALQRRNLIENNIPFVSSSQQVYLPFWGCSFFEKFKVDAPVADKMAPGTQLVFLYLYYLENTGKVNLTQIANDLQLSKATCNRAINDLAACGLIEQHAEGRIKWITPAYEKPEYLKKGFARLKSPVERNIYIKTPAEPDWPKSGLLALADISMVGADEHDGAAAICKKDSAGIPTDAIISKREFEDFGGYVTEVWSYDPTLFADGGRVDDISLLLSLNNSSNERIQMGLDEIRERHQLPIKDEE